MDARKTLEEYLEITQARKYMQGDVQHDLEKRQAELLARLFEIAEDYDTLTIVPVCPDREDPDHWKTDCWMCDHEGMAYMPFVRPKDVKPVDVEVVHQGEDKPLVQLEMFKDEKEE